MRKGIDIAELKKLGFDGQTQYLKMINSLNTSRPEHEQAVREWQKKDRSRQGLESLRKKFGLGDD